MTEKFEIGRPEIPVLHEKYLAVGWYRCGPKRYPLVYENRDAFFVSDYNFEPIDRDTINPLIADEVASRAREAWGQSWPDALSLATGIDRRRLTGVRFSSSAIPPRCLVGLAEILESGKLVRAIGMLVAALGRLYDDGVDPKDFHLEFERSFKIFTTMRS